jgi:zinc transporter ZupT
VIQGLGSLGQVLGLVLSGPFYELGGGVLTFGFGALISLMLFIVIAMMILRPRRRRSVRSA